MMIPPGQPKEETDPSTMARTQIPLGLHEDTGSYWATQGRLSSFRGGARHSLW